MGIFDKMKAAVGMGGAKVQIILDEEEKTYSQGETITGYLLLTGGSAEQTINKLSIQLKLRWIEPGEVEVVQYSDGHIEEYAESDTTNTEVLDEIVLDEPFKVDKGFEQKYDFDFEIPYGADISEEKELVYYLYAEADIPGAVDSKDRVEVIVAPSYEIQAIEEVLEDRFQFELDAEYSGDGWVYCEYIPHGKLANTVDVLGLAMFNDDEGVLVKVYFDLGGLSLWDYIRSSSGQQNEKYRVTMRYDQICPNDGDADLNIIENVFKNIFRDLRWI